MTTTPSADVKTEPISPPRPKLGSADYGFIGRGSPSSKPRFEPSIQPKIEPKVEPKVEPEPKPDPTIPCLAPPIPPLPPASYPPRTQYTPAQQAQYLQVLKKVCGYSSEQALRQVYGHSQAQAPQQVYGSTMANGSNPQGQAYAATNVHQQPAPLPPQWAEHTQPAYEAQPNGHYAQPNGQYAQPNGHNAQPNGHCHPNAHYAQHNHHHIQPNIPQIPLHTENAHHTQYHHHTHHDTQLAPPLQPQQAAHHNTSGDAPVRRSKRGRRRATLSPTTSSSTATTWSIDPADLEMLPSQVHPQTSFSDYENPDQYYAPHAMWRGLCPKFTSSHDSIQPVPYMRTMGMLQLGPLPDPVPATSDEEPSRPPTPQRRECHMALVTGNSAH